MAQHALGQAQFSRVGSSTTPCMPNNCVRLRRSFSQWRGMLFFSKKHHALQAKHLCVRARDAGLVQGRDMLQF